MLSAPQSGYKNKNSENSERILNKQLLRETTSVNQIGLFQKYEAAKDTDSKLSCYSTRILVRSYFFCIQHLPCSVVFSAMFEDGVEVRTKNILKTVH